MHWSFLLSQKILAIAIHKTLVLELNLTYKLNPVRWDTTRPTRGFQLLYKYIVHSSPKTPVLLLLPRTVAELEESGSSAETEEEPRATRQRATSSVTHDSWWSAKNVRLRRRFVDLPVAIRGWHNARRYTQKGTTSAIFLRRQGQVWPIVKLTFEF